MKPLAYTVTAGALTLILAACSGSVSQDLQPLRDAAQSCGASAKTTQIAIDITGSVRGPSLPASYEKAVRDVATHVAACDDRLRVFAFTTSDAATVTLFDRSFHVPSGTENGHLRQAQRAADDATSEVRDAYGKIGTTLAADATDVVAQFGQAADWARQQGQGSSELVILTDGFQTVGPQPLTLTAASAASGAFGRLPDLTGWNVTVAGLGRSIGYDAPSTITAQLRSFYESLCQQMHTSSCAALTDYVPRWS